MCRKNDAIKTVRRMEIPWRPLEVPWKKSYDHDEKNLSFEV